MKLSGALTLSPYVLGGYSHGLVSDGSGDGGGPFVKGGVRLAFALSPLFSLGVDASYRWDEQVWEAASG